MALLLLLMGCSRSGPHKESVRSTMELSIAPMAALSQKALEEDVAVIKKRISALKLGGVVLDGSSTGLTLRFRVKPEAMEGNEVLRRVYWLVSHTGRWSVHPVPPLPSADKLPHDMSKGVFHSIETIVSHHRKDLRNYLNSLGDPYPYEWVMLKTDERAGGVEWHAFLIGPMVKAQVSGSIIKTALQGKVVLLLDDEPWAVGNHGSITLPDPLLFSVLVKERLHVPWVMQGVSSYTRLR